MKYRSPIMWFGFGIDERVDSLGIAMEVAAILAAIFLVVFLTAQVLMRAA